MASWEFIIPKSLPQFLTFAINYNEEQLLPPTRVCVCVVCTRQMKKYFITPHIITGTLYTLFYPVTVANLGSSPPSIDDDEDDDGNVY